MIEDSRVFGLWEEGEVEGRYRIVGRERSSREIGMLLISSADLGRYDVGFEMGQRSGCGKDEVRWIEFGERVDGDGDGDVFKRNRLADLIFKMPLPISMRLSMCKHTEFSVQENNIFGYTGIELTLSWAWKLHVVTPSPLSPN